MNDADAVYADPELATFFEVNADLRDELAKTSVDPWASSPFAWIRASNSRIRGAIGERLLCRWARELGILVEKPLNSGHDCRLDGVPVEIKTSLLWSNGSLAFQQIRDHDYAVACLLAIEPFAIQLWAPPKAMLWQHARGQHGGNNATETKWCRFSADSPPAWLAPYGGHLRQATAALTAAGIVGSCLF